jgi:ferredoxin
MLDILERICEGMGKKSDLDSFEQLATQVQAGSICGLGQTAPNPVLSTLRYFREEYEAHLDGYCPAGRCSKLIHYQVNQNCVGCTLCAQACPVDAIATWPYRIHHISDETCIRCDACMQVCPHEAIEIN